MRACIAWMVSLLALTVGASAQNAETLLDNDRIVVQKFVIPPGAGEETHTRAGNQLWIQMTSGEWTAHSGLYASHAYGSRNGGVAVGGHASGGPRRTHQQRFESD